jgi:glycosyltransferase involved in cell wall biosynthesis
MAATDVVHITGTFSLEALAGMATTVLQGRPYIVSPRGSLEPWALSKKKWKKRPALTLLRPLLNRASAIHATSDMEARGLGSIGIRVPVAVVPNPIAQVPDLGGERGAWRAALKIDERALLLLILGRVHPVKGIDIAIEALSLVQRRLRSAVLVIAGPGEPQYESDLMARARSLGVESSVLRVPWTMGSDKYRLLRDADLLLLPSRQENFGNVVAEALSVGTPAIASRATPWEALEQSRCGRWVPLEPEAFANAIVDLATDRGQMDAARAQAFVEVENYSASRIVKSMIALYQACASGDPIPLQVGSGS